MNKLLNWSELEKRYVGKKFRRRQSGKQQTWRVVDVTLGGDLCCKVIPNQYGARTIPQEEFLEWIKTAREVV